MANNSSEYRVKLGLDVDIKSAQQNLLNFQQSLNKISSMNAGDLGLSKQLNEASQAAQSLQTHLNNAFDVKTGNLDLGKFQASLQKSNQTVAQLGQNLLKAGPAGEQAFLQMTRALQNANIKMLETESRLGKLLTTFKNTLRWQVSASALNAMVSGFQNALRYSQDLNKSLNDIRIVTGYSADKMAQFAKQANKAADALNTSTLKYTEASLIFFQQGLGDKAVEERTNTTIKLMNVTKESAETVSNWMTSIWNNFDDGSKSLEYYADVLAKLGATTASSADEIATGLEKFAAIGETVGLSYEYAAAALATVTAETRQSAEVVGTAFKTLFARIQDLELGKTLDDGTTLGQYSQAIAAVGINIKDANGGIKEMDVILDELGAKWNLLSKDTQIALAQNVAGIRQYTQFMAIMDNWDVFEENVKTAQEAGGALEEQAQIYADSWEAAQADVQNSLEKLWSSLVPEDQLIDLTRGLADVLDVVDTLVNAMGGLEGIILLISNLLLNKFSASLTSSINLGLSSIRNLKTQMGDMVSGLQTGGFINPFASKEKRQQAQSKRANFAYGRASTGITQAQKDQTASIDAAYNTPGISDSFKAELGIMKDINGYQNLIANSGRLITTEQKQKLNLLMEELNTVGQIQKTQLEKEASLRREKELIETNVDREHWDLDWVSGTEEGFMGLSDKARRQFAVESGAKEEAYKRLTSVNTGSIQVENSNQNDFGSLNIQTSEEGSAKLVSLKKEQLTVIQEIAAAEERIRAIAESSMEPEEKKKAAQQVITELKQKELKVGGTTVTIEAGRKRNLETISDSLKNQLDKEQKIAKAMTTSTTAIKNSVNQGKQQAKLLAEQSATAKQLENTHRKINDVLAKAGKTFSSFGKGLTTVASTAMSVTMGISTMTNAIQSWGDSEVDLSQKLTNTFMGITMLLPAITNGIKLVQDYMASMALQMTSIGALQKLNNQATWDAVAAELALLEITDETSDKEIEGALASAIASTTGTTAAAAETAAKELLAQAKKKNVDLSTKAALTTYIETDATKADTIATIANTAAKYASNPILLAVVAVIGALIAVLTIATKLQKANTESLIESAKASKEKLDALKEEKEKQDELTKSYNDAKKAYQEDLAQGKDTVASKEALNKAAEDLAEAYEIEISAIERLTGNYNSLERAMNNVKGEKAKKIVESAERSKRYAASAMKAKIREGRGHLTTDSSGGDIYSIDFAGWDPFESEVTQEFSRVIAEKNLKGFKVVDDNLEFPFTDEAIYQYGLLLQEVKDNLLANEDFKSARSGGFARIDEELEQLGANTEDGLFTQYEDALEIEKIAKRDQVYETLLQKKYGGAIETQEEYEKFLEEFSKKMKANYADIIEDDEDFSEYLREQPGLSNFADRTKAIQELMENRSEEEKEIIEDLIKKFGIEAVVSLTVIPELDEEKADEVVQALESRQAVIKVTEERENLDVLKEGFNLSGKSAVEIKNWFLNNLTEEKFNNMVKTIPGLLEEIEGAGYSKDYAGFGQFFIELYKDKSKQKNFINKLENNLLTESQASYQEESEGYKKEAALTDEERERIAVAGTSMSGIANLETEWVYVPTSDKEKRAKIDPLYRVYTGTKRELVKDKDLGIEKYEDVPYHYGKLEGFRINGKDYTYENEGELPEGLEWATLWNNYKGPQQFELDELNNYKLNGQLQPLWAPYAIDYEYVEHVTKEAAQKVFGSYFNDAELSAFMGDGLTRNEFKIKAGEITSGLRNAQTQKKNESVIDSIVSGILEIPEDSKFEPAELDLDDQIERYHELDKQLEVLNEKYEELNEETDKLYGKEKLDKIDEQIALLEEEGGIIATLKTKQTDINKNLDQDKAELIKNGFAIGENGLVTNATSVIERLTRNVNNTANEEDQEAAQKKLDAAKEALSQYEETLKLSRENTKEIEKQEELVESLGFSKIEIEFEFKSDEIEKVVSKFEHYIKLLNDDIYSTSEKIYFNNKIFEENINKYNVAKQAYRDALTQGDTEENINKYLQELYQAEEAVSQSRKQLGEDLKTFFSDAGAEIDKTTEALERQNSFLEHYNNLSNLFGDGKNYGLNKKILETQEKNLDYQHKTAMKKTSYYNSEIRRIEKEYEKTGNEELKKVLEELQTMRDEAAEAELAALEAKLEKAKEIAELALEEAKDTFSRALSDGVGLETLIENIEQEAEVAEHYLTDTNKMYETSKLEREAQLAIDKTDNLLAKQRLKAYQDEIKALQNKSDVSEFELTVAKERFEVLKAQIALEEAQANKSQMRLMRNAAGGYSYVYTTDETNIAEAQQQLDDAQNKSYNTIRKQVKDSYNNYIKTMSDAEKALDELYQARLNNEITDEEYQRQYEQLTQYYYERLLQHERDFTQARALLGEDRYQTEFGYLNDSLINVANWSEKQKEYNKSTNESLKEYEKTTEEVRFGFGNLEHTIGEVDEKSQDLYETLIKTLIPTLEAETKEVLNQTKAYNMLWKAKKGEEIDYSSAILNSKTMADVKFYGTGRDSKIATMPNFTGVPTENLTRFMEKVLSGDKDAKALWEEIQNSPYITDAQAAKLMKYETGGYTGSWGAGGRLAMLHEKELVLNKQDTQNVLDAVQILRDMSSALGNEIRANALGLASTIGSRSFKVGFDGKETIVQQVVSIDATFPGVQSAIEIETALQSLVNDAAQQVSIRRD